LFVVVCPGTKAWKEIKRRFGDDIIQTNGEINR
jgi:dephospho-CoA kinase